MVTKLDKETFYLILEKDYENKEAYAHELVEDGPEEFQFKNLRGQDPDDDKSQHTEENVQRAAFLHYFI